MKIAIEAGKRRKDTPSPYDKRTELKEMGCKWLPWAKCWVWFGEHEKMIEISVKIEELGLEPYLCIETQKLPTLDFQGVYYSSPSDFPQGSPEWELGRQFYERF